MMTWLNQQVQVSEVEVIKVKDYIRLGYHNIDTYAKNVDSINI